MSTCGICVLQTQLNLPYKIIYHPVRALVRICFIYIHSTLFMQHSTVYKFVRGVVYIARRSNNSVLSSTLLMILTFWNLLEAIVQLQYIALELLDPSPFVWIYIGPLKIGSHNCIIELIILQLFDARAMPLHILIPLHC